MESRSKEYVTDKLQEILECIDIIQQRSHPYASVNDFLTSPDGMIVLDSCILRLQVMGEAVRAIDDETCGTLLSKYPQVRWKDAIGLRNIISHQYANVDYDIIVDIIQNELDNIRSTTQKIISELR